MKLCIVSHAYRTETYLPVLKSIAAAPGIDLTVVTPSYFERTLVLAGLDLTFCHIPIAIRFGSRQGTYVYSHRHLKSALKAIRPEIILHEQEVFSLSAGQVASLASGMSIPLVMFVWENLHRSLAIPRRWLRNYVLERCSGLITGSTQSTEVHRSWGFEGPIRVIPQMGSKINPSPSFVRRSPGVLKICFAGRLIESKGIDCLLRAVSILKSRGIKTACTIAGHGPVSGRLKFLTAQLGILDCVDLCGRLSIDGVASLLKDHDVLVLPSRRTRNWEEQFGRILAEAMAQATVTVGSATVAIPEVIGSADLIFEQDSSVALADILERLDRDVEFFESHQRRLWARARDNYDNEVLTHRRVTFLQEVVASGRSMNPCMAGTFAGKESPDGA